MGEEQWIFERDDLEEEFNRLLNEALCHKGGVKRRNSNEISEFITRYMEEKL